MKSKTLLAVLLFLSNFVFGQDIPHSIITFIRPNTNRGESCRTDISFQNQRPFNLSFNSIVKYKIYSKGEITLTLEIVCPAGPYSSYEALTRQITLNIDSNKEYYVLFDVVKKVGVVFKEVQKSEVEQFVVQIQNVIKHQENIESPISKSILKVEQKIKAKQASCFLISSEGYFITNYHCVDGAKEISIRGIDGDFTSKIGATLIATDIANNLALLKINSKIYKFTPPPFGIRRNSVNNAEKIYAFGYPIVEGMKQEIEVIESVVSSKTNVKGDISKFQISKSVYAGNTGGPVFDAQGDLIGVMYSDSTIYRSIECIKSTYLDAFLKNIENFNSSQFVNTYKAKSIADKIQDLKEYVFILETN